MFYPKSFTYSYISLCNIITSISEKFLEVRSNLISFIIFSVFLLRVSFFVVNSAVSVR